MTNAPRFETRAIADPGDLGTALSQRDAAVWLHGRDGFVARGEAARFDPGAGEGRFDRAAEMFEDFVASVEIHDAVAVAGTGPVAFASFTFDPDSTGSVMVVPARMVGRRNGVCFETCVAGYEDTAAEAEVRNDDRVRYLGSSISELRWLEAVAHAERAVAGGELEKVVLARDLKVWSKSPLAAGPLIRRLAARFPECYTFALSGLVGATPELLVRRAGERVDSVVLAGSAPRGTGPDEDEAAAAALLGSAKDRREHEPAVRSVAEVLRPLCRELRVDGAPHLMRLANVMHLATSVRGTLREPRSSLRLAGALHPTAAVCGLPRSDALALLRELEQLDRGRYAGPVGWVDGRGDGEWGIALRCAELDGARARLFAGGGIVAGSVPEAELEETRVKLNAMQDALEGA